MTKLQKSYSSSDALALSEKIQQVQNSIAELERIEPNSAHELNEKKKLLLAYEKEMKLIRKTVQNIQESPLPSASETTIQAVAFEDEALAEKAKELKAIESHIIEINSMLKDCAETIQEQGKDLDSIENFVEISSDSTKDAVSELEQANSYQNKGSKCCIYTTVIAALIAGVIILLFYLFFSDDNDDNKTT